MVVDSNVELELDRGVQREYDENEDVDIVEWNDRRGGLFKAMQS